MQPSFPRIVSQAPQGLCVLFYILRYNRPCRQPFLSYPAGPNILRCHEKTVDKPIPEPYNIIHPDVPDRLGGIAQLARAFGSYPECHLFESDCRYHCSTGFPALSSGEGGNSRPGGQAAKTPPFHGGNTGSIPVRVTTWRHSSAGRAPAPHAGGHRFESRCLHQSPEILLISGLFSCVCRKFRKKFFCWLPF